MTTIAIIGGGIAARSLVYSLAKKNFPEKLLVFYSDNFAFPCSLHSTAIVAPRGISPGHSPLGDELVGGFERFDRHVKEDRPEGVIKVRQSTGAITKMDEFKKRYPIGEMKDGVYFAEEDAYLIRPSEYMAWLLKEAQKNLDLEIIPHFVTEVKDKKITTQDGKEFTADKIIFAAGVNNDLWSSLFSTPRKTKSAQGSYLEFTKADLGANSFSLTLEGDNLIYDADRKKLLIGSTTKESALELAPEKALKQIYEDLSSRTSWQLPDFQTAIIRVGLREKGPKRESYILNEGHYSMIGGLYKNGYRLTLYLAEKLLSSLLPE
ncbi:MAG: FAD-dependent oxidoreductase [Bacteriovoracaceae bacterium]